LQNSARAQQIDDLALPLRNKGSGKLDLGQTHREKNKWAILFVTVMLPFMATLDTNIVNVALPIMADKLQVTSSMIAWVASAYLIVLTSGILFFGRLGDLKGHTKVFRYGILVFTFGSFLCSLSPTFEILIFARIVQSLGAAATMANNQGIISSAFPKNERGRALGINGAFVALGTLAGPSLGGFIISMAGWEYMFWINVPIGIIVFVAGFWIFPKEEETADGSLDFLGAVLFAFSMIPFFVALQQGQAVGFTSPFILSCFALAIVSFLLFLFVQKKSKDPLLKLDIFKNRWFSISIFCSFTSYMAISCYNIVLPFYLQDVLRMVPAVAGLYMTIYPLLIVLVSPASGYLSDKIGSEILTLLGLVLTSAGLLLMSTLTEQVSLVVMGLFIIIMAIGNGLFQSPNNSLVMSSVAQDKLGIGGSVNALVRSIGQTAGIAVSTSLLYGGMSMKIGRHVTDYVPGRNDAFLFGMRFSYLAAAAICMLGVIITAVRLHDRRAKEADGI
jgi:EmrB/QacA subfamily drug resistance transporter